MAQSATAKKDLAKTADSKVSAIKDRATDTLEKGAKAAQDTVDHATERAKVATDEAQKEIRKLTDTGADFVRENPGTAIVGAVGVGILLGLALRGRD
ncbi:hypothetical protein [Yoonia algicola]|uniref:DUF883 domain-containing protein n=1 Tax=Yoonia algicola TaxID=3137368 RepID=A0AAN0M1Y1_9RHOB